MTKADSIVSWVRCDKTGCAHEWVLRYKPFDHFFKCTVVLGAKCPNCEHDKQRITDRKLTDADMDSVNHQSVNHQEDDGA